VHDLPVLTTIAAAFTAAWLLGLLTQKLGLSPIVGYLLGGVLIGPYTPGFVGDLHIAQELAEVGVILLMFGVGLHFHLDDLLAVRRVAIPGAIVQSLVATVAAVLVFSAFGMPAKSGAVIGMAMAVASTVVLMRVLMDADALNTPEGHVAVGWLIVEDIFTVILLVLLPVLADGSGVAGEGDPWLRLAVALGKLLALVGVVWIAGSRLIPWILTRVARLRSRELFTLTVLVLSIAVAAGAYFVFGASMALGAFLAGMVVGQSPLSHQAAADALPMRDAFAVLFFVSVGMLFDPAFLVREPLLVLAGLSIILVAKPLAALAIVLGLGYSARTALTVAIGLAQIGEFSFILSEVARDHRLLSDDGHHLLVGAAILSITVNPLLFRSLPRIEGALRSRPRLWAALNGRAARRAGKLLQPGVAAAAAPAGGDRRTIVVGYGPVGRSVHRMLQDAGIRTVVVDLNPDVVSELHAAGHDAIYGDAANPTILEGSGIATASHLVVTVPGALDRTAVVAAARQLNPETRVLVRARYLREREDLERSGVAGAVFEEAEGAVALARLVLADAGVHRETVAARVRDLRLQLIRETLGGKVDEVLEEVVRRIEEEHPEEPGFSLPDVVAAGGVVFELEGTTADQVIRELVAAIPARRLPADARVAELALARELEVTTDLGNGVAVPHARLAGMRAPVIVFGRSRDGVAFSASSPEPVKLVFLLVTPAERPEVQLALVAKVAAAVALPEARQRLRAAGSLAEVFELLSRLAPRRREPAG
jgi:CPA2 family monovalent cation:H+ antiporter-2